MPPKRPKPPLVSIVTPNLNKAPFLAETMASVLGQDYEPLEYIIIDGGSNDGSVEIIRRQQDRLAFWVSERDQGQTQAINKGFKRARGEIVAWLNSDDLYYPGAIKRAAALFRNDPDLALLYGDGAFLTPRGDFLSYYEAIEPFDLRRLTSFSNFILQPTTFFRRSALADLGFLDQDLEYLMDWDLWCRLARAGYRFKYLPELLAADRRYQQTKTISGGGRRLKEAWSLMRHHKHTLWPHAWFGLAAAHLRESLALAPGAERRLLLAAGALGATLLNGRNLLHNATRPRFERGVRLDRGAGGMLAGVPLLARRAQISLPVWGNPRELRLALRPLRPVAGKSLRVRLELGGEADRELILADPRQAAQTVLPLPASLADNHLLSVGFSFFGASPKRRWLARLERFELR